MKTTFLRNSLFVALLATGLAFTSCKEKTTETETTTEVTDTTGTLSSEPIGDTIVTDKDTVVETGTPNDTKENPTGTQVP
jgi:hypothetical protein